MMVWRLEGAVDVSDSDILSKVPSLWKLDFLSKDADSFCCLRPPIRPSWKK